MGTLQTLLLNGILLICHHLNENKFSLGVKMELKNLNNSSIELTLVKPSYEELLFRQKLLSDEKTMSYNAKWGGIIHFDKERWRNWYTHWVDAPSDKAFYRYLYSKELNTYVGEVTYHYDQEFNCYLCDILIMDCFRRRGYGQLGLSLLLKAAKDNGISAIHDNIALDNASINLFLKSGFSEKWRNVDFVMLEKRL